MKSITLVFIRQYYQYRVIVIIVYFKLSYISPAVIPKMHSLLFTASNNRLGN